MQERPCTIEQCDIFDFMAKYVGLSVLHPGGFEATKKLARACQIGPDTKVLDIACGKGTTALFLAKEFGCRVKGVDISEDLIEEASAFAMRSKVAEKVQFQVGDALDLAYPDNEFDVAVSQAMLILVRNKCKTIGEAKRVVKPGGYAGWLELSWKKQPPEEFMDAVSNVICAYCMTNVLTYEKWEDLFRAGGFSDLEIIKSSMPVSGIKGMIKDEGFRNTINVMSKYLFNFRVRKRMDNLNTFMKSNSDYFGYGIYILRN
jgi:ubiquinone/menaquinone biosynthesis C-methylase UbiE